MFRVKILYLHKLETKITLDEERDTHLTGDEQNKGNESKLEDIVL